MSDLAAADHGRKAHAALLGQLRDQGNAALSACERWFDGDEDAAGTLLSTLAQLELVAKVGQLEGIALLAVDCRLLAESAGEDASGTRRQAVAEGLVALGGHLSAAQSGAPAPAGNVVADINRLRVARGAPALDARTLFIELMHARAPYPVPFSAPTTAMPPQATVAQRALDPARKIAAALKRGGDPKPGLEAVRKLAGSLERTAASADALAPWWLARVVAEQALAAQVEAAGAAAALAELDARVEELSGGAPVDPGWAYRLLYVLRAAPQGDAEVARIDRVYGLRALTTEVISAPTDGAGAGDARGAVAEAAREELARVRDAFDVFLRSGAADTNLLKPAVARLDMIVAPLQVADLGIAAELLADVRTSLAALVEGQPLGNTANAIADQMLRAEEVLSSGVEGPGDKLRDEAIRALVDAAQDVLSGLRQALFEASEVGDDEALADMPAKMAQFAGALEVSGLDEASALVREAADTMRGAAGGGAPLDALAEALVCLEMYLGARRDRPDAPTDLLRRARSVLGEAIPAGERSSGKPADEEPPVVAGDPDPDLLDIYVEEAKECMVEARARVAEWRADPDAAGPRGELQRLFHTLKGSGRMVGALRIAEFSKCFEDLIGRLEESGAAPTPAVVELMGAAVAALPALVEQIISGTDPGIDLRPLRKAAETSDPAAVPGATARPVLVALAARHFDTVHRWLDAVSAGKGSGQVPAAVCDALRDFSSGAEVLGALQVSADAAVLRERLETAAAVDEPLQREVAGALDAMQAAVAPLVDGQIDAVAADAYREEAHALLDRMGAGCDALLQDAADGDAVLGMQRVLHTLKGASRVAGFRALSDIAHTLEAVLRAIAQEKMIVTPRLLWTLGRAFDAMYGMLEPDTAATAGERAAQVIEELKQLSGDDRSLPPVSSGADRRRKPRVAAESERVRSDQFDRALVRALSLGLRSAALDRQMHEQTMWNIATIGGVLKELADDAAAIRDLLVRARVAPVHTHASRWRRTARQAAEDTGREVELRFEGSETEVDRRLLDALIAPFEHLLRNAVAHGIESPFARRAAGKPAAGVIVIRTVMDREGVVIEIEDDGAGVDVDKVRRSARDRGLAIPEGTLDNRKLLTVLATPGFSTAPAVTHASGYGMGVDTVCAAIRELGGRVELDTTVGKGTRFSLHLPNPSPVLAVELVRAGNALVAIPWQNTVGVRTFEEGATEVEHDGESWPLVEIAGAIGLNSARTAQDARTAVLVRSGQSGIAVIVDENLGETEVAMHRLRPGDLRGGVCVAGVGLLDGGRLSTVINVQAAIEAAGSVLKIRPYAFIADDSPTARDEVVRKLERLGWRVMAVEDGSQARQRLARERPQLIVLDVDMPGYDGLTIVEWLRSENALPGTPIILVSAEFTEQRRQRAADLGIAACVAKPFAGVEFEDAVASLQR